MKFHTPNDALPVFQRVKKLLLEANKDLEFSETETSVTVHNPANGKIHALVTLGDDYSQNWAAEEHDVPVILKALANDPEPPAANPEANMGPEHEEAKAEGGGEQPEEKETHKGDEDYHPDFAGSDKDPNTKAYEEKVALKAALSQKEKKDEKSFASRFFGGSKEN